MRLEIGMHNPQAGFLLLADAVLGHAQKGHFVGSKFTGRALVALVSY